MNKSTYFKKYARTRLASFCVLFFAATILLGCEGSQVLSPEPTALDLDGTAPSCPGITSATAASGPSISLTWGEATDNLSTSSTITYSVFMKTASGSYDLLSPAKIVLGATSTLITNGVQLGQTYFLYVKCQDEAQNAYPTGPMNEQSVTISDTTAPTSITDLTAGSPSFSSILLTWSPADDGAGGTTSSQMVYRIYRSTSASVSTSGTPLVSLTGTTSYTNSGLVSNTTYYYRVIAEDIAGNRSSSSNEASATTLADVTAPYFSPYSGIQKDSSTATSITFDWLTATDNVTSSVNLVYYIYRCSGSTTCDPFSTSALATTSPGITTYTDSGLSASTVYVYGVRARDSSNNESTNTDTLVTSTAYASTGSFFSYPTTREVGIRMGQSVAVANVIGNASGGSAYPDLIVGAPNASEPGANYTNTGCVYIFAGTAVGTFATTPSQVICQPNPTADGQGSRNFGYAIASGDFDDNGTTDFVVTSPYQNKMFIFRTTSSGGVLTINTSSTPITYGSGETYFGLGICTGNSDNSGATDIFVTSSYEDCNGGCTGTVDSGNLLVYTNASASSNFVIPSLSYKISPTSTVKAAGYVFGGQSYTETVARSCAMGNFDSSNPSDQILVIGSGNIAKGTTNNQNGMIIFYRKTAANTFAAGTVIDSESVLPQNSQWGETLARVRLSGSVDSLFIGAPNDGNAGAASGAAYGYSVAKPVATFTLTDLGATFYGGSDFNNNGMGSGIAAGDIWAHGDGSEDLVIGSYLDDGTLIAGSTGIDFGQVFTYRNVGGSISSSVQQTNFDPSNVNARTRMTYGRSLCSGDLNGDGEPDVVIGSSGQGYDENTMTNNGNSGAVYVYYGENESEIDFANPDQIIYAPGNQTNGYFGTSCTIMDFDNDGAEDLIVGSPYRDNGARTDQGSIFVYWAANGQEIDPLDYTKYIPPHDASGVFFGMSLAHGDVDGNGFDDLLVGSHLYDSWGTDTGRAWVFWATNTTGLINMSSYTILDPPNGNAGTANNPHLANHVPTQNSMNFGISIAAFKTVAGSSAKDVVVCAHSYDYAAAYFDASQGALNNVGLCFIYEGGVNDAGSTGSYKVMTKPRNDIRYPYGHNGLAQADQYFGTSMTAGDWDNDGLDDLVICGYRQRNLTTSTNNAGGCFQYKGKSGGGFEQTTSYKPNFSNARYSPVADDSFYNPNTETSATSFGISVGLADVNDNGRPDLLVGEHEADNFGGPANLGKDSGRVFIIRGGY